MKYLSIISIVALALAGDSPISTDSKGKAPLVARFKKTSKSDIEGTIKFEPANNGTVLVSVDLTGLPSGVGPYPYHVHEKPVPESKNCTATGMHFNPFNGSTTAKTPAALELGDLSGRHGNITSESFEVEYDDSYISLNKDSKAYIGGLSIVVHSNNNTRLNCANITTLDEGDDTASAATWLNSSSSSSSSSKNSTNGSSGSSTSASQGSGAGRAEISGFLAAGIAGVVAALI